MGHKGPLGHSCHLKSTAFWGILQVSCFLSVFICRTPSFMLHNYFFFLHYTTPQQMSSSCKDTKIQMIMIQTMLLSVTQQRHLCNDAAINRSPVVHAIHQKLDFSPGQTLVSSLSPQMATTSFFALKSR